MKLITLLSLSVIMIPPAMAQIKKGQFLVGGNISFESIKSEAGSTNNYKSTNFSLSPNIGYFFIQKLAGGLRVTSSSNKDDLSVSYHRSSLSISPYLRYYLLPALKKVNAFIDLGYLYNRTKWSSYSYSSYYPPNYPTSNTQKSSGYSISAGPAIFLNDHIALEFTVGYRHLTADNVSKIETSTINTGLGLQVHLGKVRSKVKAKNK